MSKASQYDPDQTYKEIVIEPDGYVRKSPIQEIRISPDYYKNLRRNAILAILLIAAAIFAVWVLWKYNIIGL